MVDSRFVYVIYIRTTPEKLWDALTKPEFHTGLLVRDLARHDVGAGRVVEADDTGWAGRRRRRSGGM